MKRTLARSAAAIFALFAWSHAALAQQLPSVTLKLSQSSDPTEVVPTLQIIGLMTLMALAPALVLMMTSFTRILVVLHFVRQAMGANQVPPAQLVVGLALILSFYVMSPTLNTVNETALKPYMAKTIDQQTALDNATKPFKEFMMRQVREKDLALFVNLSGQPRPENPSDIGLSVLVPAFIISELRISFQIGFALYLPFLIIDMVVSSVLLAMGMMMLPPVMVSLPFKILLFVMVDGWYLVVESLVKSFR
ncbi:MAG: flagellar type III secretion system pore protein FliP [bacterium]|nr:flagellar type III secretion system pore protein FliP [bacterium]